MEIPRREKGKRSGGRPPRTQAAIVVILKKHQELRGKPKAIARLLSLTFPYFNGITPDAVSGALSRLMNRFSGRLDFDLLCADEQHVGRIARSAEGKGCCCVCGREYDIDERDVDPGVAQPADQRAIFNPLHRIHDGNPLPYPRKHEGMISQAARTQAAFGTGVIGKLKEKALKGLEQLRKGFPLPQDRTARLASLVDSKCEERGKYVKRATLDEAKSAVVSALLDMAKVDPSRSSTYLDMIDQTNSYFPDLTKSAKLTKHTLLDEEEAVSRVGEDDSSNESAAENEETEQEKGRGPLGTESDAAQRSAGRVESRGPTEEEQA